MKKFSQNNLNTIKLKEGILPKVSTYEEYITFGKDVCKSIMGDNYKDAAVQEILDNIFKNSSNNVTLALEELSAQTMSEDMFIQKIKNQFSELFERFIKNPTDYIPLSRISLLRESYPYIVNDCILDEAKALADILYETTDEEEESIFTDTYNPKNVTCSYYSPKDFDEIAKSVNGLTKVMHEMVQRTDASTFKRQRIKTELSQPYGYGGVGVETVTDKIYNQKQEAEITTSMLNKTLNVLSSTNAFAQDLYKTTISWFTAFMKDSVPTYDFDSKKIKVTGCDLAYFIKLGLDEMVSLIRDNQEYLSLHFKNQIFTRMSDDYSKFTDLAGIFDNINQYKAQFDERDIFDLRFVTDPSKMYELYMLMIRLTPELESNQRGYVNDFLKFYKPMLDKLRLDWQTIISHKTNTKFKK